MFFTKTQARVMKLFCGEITALRSILQVSKRVGVGYALIHKAVHDLLRYGLLCRDEHGLIGVNYKKHVQDFAYIESLRAEEFRTRYPDIGLFESKVINQMNGFFILLVFGSYAKGKQKKDSDVDILMIVERTAEAEKQERALQNTAETFLKHAECRVIGLESVQEMLAKREKVNVLNETLNNHILLFGAEAYYRLLQER